MVLMLIIVLQMVNHLVANIVEETPERPPQPWNAGDADQPAQPLVTSLKLEASFLLK